MNYRNFKQAPKKRLLLTKEGLDGLKKKLDAITAKRKQALQELQSLPDGDSDDFTVNTRLQMLESAEKEAAELDKLLQHVEPIIKPRAPKKVALGCTAKLKNGERTVHYTIVCSLEIDLQNNRISEDSVLGKAVLGKKVGDVFSITTPSGDLFSYEVISIN